MSIWRQKGRGWPMKGRFSGRRGGNKRFTVRAVELRVACALMCDPTVSCDEGRDGDATEPRSPRVKTRGLPPRAALSQGQSTPPPRQRPAACKHILPSLRFHLLPRRRAFGRARHRSNRAVRGWCCRSGRNGKLRAPPTRGVNSNPL